MANKKSTRAAQGAGTIRQRADGRWEARITVGHDAGTGKQIQKSVYGSTQAEVRKKLTAITAEVDSGTYLPPTKMTVAQWLEVWQSEYMGDVKPLTVSSYKQSIRLYLVPYLGKVKLQALNTIHIQTMYNTLTKGEKPLSAKSIKNLHGVFHKALQQAVAIGYLRFNPADACKLPRVEKHEIKPLDEEQIQTFIEAVHGHKYEYVYLTALFTGMRQGEILGLTWDCVDFKTGSILINKQLQKLREGKDDYVLSSTKSGKARCIVAAPFVMRVLKDQRKKQLSEKLAAPDIWANEWNLVFTNELGGHLCAMSVYNCFKRLCAHIGFETTRFHDLRHSYAVAAIRAGDDIKTVQSNLGHATASFTLDIYGHCTDKMKQESAERMERFINSL